MENFQASRTFRKVLDGLLEGRSAAKRSLFFLEDILHLGGIVALFLLAMGAISLWFGVLNNRLPLVRHGQISLVPAGYGADCRRALGDFQPRLCRNRANRIASLQGAANMASSGLYPFRRSRRHPCLHSLGPNHARSFPEALTTNSFAGAIAFLTLAIAAFVWNICASTRSPAHTP
jgi:hypothetical protein